MNKKPGQLTAMISSTALDLPEHRQLILDACLHEGVFPIGTCYAIRDEDNDLLRAMAAAAPSKILVSSRLTPRVLLNPSGQPITGAKRSTNVPLVA